MAHSAIPCLDFSCVRSVMLDDCIRRSEPGNKEIKLYHFAHVAEGRHAESLELLVAIEAFTFIFIRP